MALRSQAPRTVHQRRRVLLVDDAEGIRTYLKGLLTDAGYDAVPAEDGERALAWVEESGPPDAVLLDVDLPGIDGFETLRRLKRLYPSLPVIMLSVVGKASTIVEALQLGAADFLNKPFEAREIADTLAKLLNGGDEPGPQRAARASGAGGGEEFCWSSEKMQRIRAVLAQVSDADVTVLITGESGVGKEVISREIHRMSTRQNRAFVKVNCAALPEELLESELFGYERGAFTGASARKPGKFEIANGGTIFLDEIGEMSPGLQAKLLQVLQDGEFSRLGGQTDIRVDVRVVAATNRDLEEMCATGRFREDLYYRLNVVNVYVPPLRERRDEIPQLAQYFLAKYAEKYGRSAMAITPELMQGFAQYPWPGNIRELENMVKRIVVLQSEEAIAEEVFGAVRSAPAGAAARSGTEDHDDESGGPPPWARGGSAPVVPEVPGGESLSLREIGRRAARDAEREALRRVLYQTNWNRKKAARLLDVSYKTLLIKIKECGLAD
jgi:two-component system, NtrC family, response regulator AtoC